MKPQVTPIRINPDLTVVHDERLVKRGALHLFRLVRSAVTHGKTVPGLLQRAAEDVAEAWRESARPNV